MSTCDVKQTSHFNECCLGVCPFQGFWRSTLLYPRNFNRNNQPSFGVIGNVVNIVLVGTEEMLNMTSLLHQGVVVIITISIYEILNL